MLVCRVLICISVLKWIVEVRGRREGYNDMCTRNIMGVKVLSARYVRGEKVQKEK